jgi:hypothetical protein
LSHSCDICGQPIRVGDKISICAHNLVVRSNRGAMVDFDLTQMLKQIVIMHTKCAMQDEQDMGIVNEALDTIKTLGYNVTYNDLSEIYLHEDHIESTEALVKYWLTNKKNVV